MMKYTMADSEAKQGWTESGMAILCFDSTGNKSFQGRLVAASGKQYGLMGRSCSLPPSDTHYHQCCFDADPVFFKITVIDFQRKSEATVKYVMKTNGDNCSLSSEEVQFDTDELIVGRRADETIGKYFAESLLGKDCIVCVGQWNMCVDFPCPVEQIKDNDSDF